jgi:outer membrane protein assembly factor BamA
MVERYCRKKTATISADSLHQFLIDNGFLDSRVRIDSSGVIYPIFGRAYKIGRILLSKDGNDKIDIDRDLNEYNLSAAFDSIIADYQKQGFYYTALTSDSIIRREATIDIYGSLNKGPLVKISAIDYNGLKRTNPQLVGKYINLESGDILNRAEIEKSIQALKRINFLNVIDSADIIPDVGYQTASIKYNFIEKRQFNLNGGGGYIPDQGGQFLWFINLAGNNIFGQGIKAGLLIDQREKEKSIFRITYGQPLFLLGLGWGELAMQTRDYRKQFYEFSLSGKYELSINQQFSFLTKLGWKNIEPSDTTRRSYKVYSAGVGIVYGAGSAIEECRNDYGLRWEIEYLGRNYGSGNDSVTARTTYNDTKIILGAESSWNPYRRFANHLSFDLHDIESSEKPLPLSEQVTFGGPMTLRGYRNDQFVAQRLVLVREEVRYFFGAADFFYPFIDAAYFEYYDINQAGQGHKKDDFKIGYGAGVKILSGTNAVKIEFSWGEDNNFGEPRINITLSNQF